MDGLPHNICFYELDPLSSTECGCTILGTVSVTINREHSNGSPAKIISLSSGAITNFLGILNGTSSTSISIGPFEYNCDGQHWTNYLGFDWNSTGDTMSVVHIP